MKIHSGLFDSMVLQRDSSNQSDAQIEGVADVAGDVYARVSKSGKPLAGLRNRKVGACRNRKFKLRLRGVPVGGPYEVELSIRQGKMVLDTLAVRNVLVGDVWLAGGQSNMQGYGRRANAAKPHPMVRAFYMDDRWAVARDPIHNMWDCVDQVHVDLNSGARPMLDKIAGVGPGVAFGQEMFRRTGVPQGVIACAHGGTAMCQWDPKLKPEGSRSLYGAMVRRLGKNGGKVAGLIWYQGESETAVEERVGEFTRVMTQFIAAVRKDARSPRLPVVMVQISRVVAGNANVAGWNSIQEQQRLLAERIANVATVPAIDLRLDDGIHIGTPDVNRLGRRIGQAMHALVTGGKNKKGSKPPIRLRGTRFEIDPVRGWADLIVEFDHVEGKLRSGGDRPAGFSLVNGNVPAIYDVVLDTDSVRLRTNLPAAVLTREFDLHYGQGVLPTCNITDAADRSLPVFGPLPLGSRGPLTPFVQQFQVSQPLEGKGNLKSVSYPREEQSLGWRTIPATDRLCDLHAEWSKLPAADRLYYIRVTIDVPEPMKLAMLLGYDGPVKVWIDGKQRFHDPAGNNPAFPDKAAIGFNATAGRHDLLVALGTNFHRAWGIFLRFERTDLPRNTANEKGAENALPVVA